MIKGSEVLSIDGIVPGYSFFAKKKLVTCEKHHYELL